ncbi:MULTISPECIES: type II secretion system F family protein [unclassified Streptomyces]|uniref:type II secretion system F family protein n=1 Tax=unclassified Streptomyces TaxID=2593676 RepID=UPI00081F010E|nr:MULTISPECIES: type II secretion system F family protein [unclassified Streptomyces]MYR30518.1 type II secretion system protein [Streptomyces sp. SID4945]SCD35706.1 Flp pilus assembly protein TadB [Streptomyces sp. TverLS-915]SCF49991.1 Flp pilus assembly protein TadB [Streptomyces sp. LcepLS]
MNSQWIGPVVAGAVVGLGIYVLVRALLPGARSPLQTVARVDALRARGAYEPPVHRGGKHEEDDGRFATARASLGLRLAAFYRQQGWELRSLRADLAVLDRSWERFLATKVLLGVAGLVFGPAVFAIVAVLGIGRSPLIPVWLALLCGILFFFLPDLEIRRDAQDKRRDLRRVIGAYLDLVAMSLAGGRGLPEALLAAAEVSDGWASRRIRDALQDARITGHTQWYALGRLGEELGIEELKELSSSLALVADDGAKVRESLASRAETMRHRELAEIEGSAGEKSQSMLIAQLLLCAGFLVFLIFPAAMRVFQM